MNRLRAVVLLSLLALLVIVSRVTGKADAAVFVVQSTVSDNTEAKRDLLALLLAYPEDITGVEKADDGLVYVLIASGARIVYDDKRSKSFDEQLWNADIEDTMSLPYPPDMIIAVPKDNNDPGRLRCYALLNALYGSTQSKVEKSLRSVSPFGRFNQRGGAAAALESAFADIDGLMKVDPNISRFVYPMNGTFNYRVIAGTNTLSPHAFGIAIDLASGPGDYWRWATREAAQIRLSSYPPELVQAMEAHGFIWGGKWAHFDYLHFEYRPEIIIKAKAGSAKTGGAWHMGFPEDERTQELIRQIDAALG